MRTLWLLLIALFVLALPVAAQSNLTYGATVTGQTNTQYQFSGAAGDLIVAQAVGISPDFVPVLTLLDPAQLQAGQAHSDPLTPGATALSARLPIDGTYSLLVSSLNGSSGQFVLTLNGSPISSAMTLAAGQTSIQLDTVAQVYQFNGPAEIDLSADLFAFSAEILDQDGQMVAQLNDVPRATFAIDSGGRFQMTLQARASGAVNVTYTVRADLLPAGQVIPPTSTPAATEALVPATETPADTSTEIIPPPPTLLPTPTVEAKIAPTDNDYTLAIPLDGEIILSDFVSYPEGDRLDIVQYQVTGLDQNQSVSTGVGQLQIKASCAGKGTDSVTFFVAGKIYHCGDTIVNGSVTYTTRSGTIQIAASGGDGTYVQWMLTGSATHTS